MSATNNSSDENLPSNSVSLPTTLPVVSAARLPHLLDQSQDQLAEWLESQGQPAFRLKQILGWIYTRRAESFEAMSDLPKSLRDGLAASFSLFASTIAAHQKSDDGTEKLLVQLADGGRVECVLLRDGIRRSICVSSQVGCAMGCVFCASVWMASSGV